jgi:hypothetical protein
LGLKLLCDAHASSRVASTVKWSLERYRLSGAWARTCDELVGDVVVQEAAAVLGEGGRVECGFVDAKVPGSI